MNPKIFWSWQSDKLGKVSRHFLKKVLEEAIQQAGEELDLDESKRPSIDHDTKGEPGLVSIPDSILAKIDAATVFVADLTPIARTGSGRFVANPNVLIELGYAKKAVGPGQIILIWNSAWGGCEPDDLPFDLRHRRMPFTFSLSETATNEQIAAEKMKLVPALKEAIKACLLSTRPIVDGAVRIAGIPSRDGDPSVWFADGQTITVNNDTSYGSDKIQFREGPRSYLRIIPARWNSDHRSSVVRQDQRMEFEPLGRSTGFSWGRAKGGSIIYRVGERNENAVTSLTATQWFYGTGELWGFDCGVIFEVARGRKALATDYVVECWSRFLRKAAEFYEHYGVAGPYAVVGGITQLKDVIWPPDMWQTVIEAIEEAVVHTETVTDLNEQTQRSILENLHTAMRDAFGLNSSTSELDQILTNARR
jgi:hypothetical protein